jgi:hypothetical protein
MALILRSEIGRRLTVPEIDGNFTYLENLAMGLTESSPYQSVELTYTQALALLASEGVVDGKRYLITEFDVELYGGTDILVSGLPNNQFSTSGYGKFYNPNYGSMSVWDSSATYSIDDLVIYGGKVWKNITGSVGSPDSILILNDTNWLLQEVYTNTDHYVTVWDQIELGFADGFFCINSRYDSYRNNYVRVGQLDDPALGGDRWFNCGVSPIQVFGWGNNNINDCDIKDSYFNCVNVIGSTTIYGVKMSNYSFIFDTTFKDSTIEGLNFENESGCYTLDLDNSNFRNINMTNESYISDITLSNNSYFERVDISNRSYIENVHLDNSNMYEIKFDNYSYMRGNSLIELYDNSSMTYLSLDNHSRISQNIGLTGSSYFKRINMTNRSRIEGPIDFQNNSRIEKIDATNDSYITDLSFNNNSYMENLDISSSDFGNIGLSASYINNVRTFTSYVEDINIINNSSFQYINMDRSYFSSLQAYNNSNIGLIDLNSAYLDLTSLGTYSRSFPSGTSFRSNELKYQFDLTFNGTSGYGLTGSFLNIPSMLMPQDFYIEKVIIETSGLTYSGDSTILSLSTPGLSPSIVEIAVSEIYDKIKVLDISNGLIVGSKADSNKMLTAFLTGGTNITSGEIKMEVTIKSTRYFYD